jgi:hypothetical protein
MDAINQHLLACKIIREEIGEFGEWTNEPDRIQWEYKGYTCLMSRNPALAWCGYVALKFDHPYYEKSYDELDDLSVHGGLTYSEHCSGHICHDSEDITPVWWLGFDCSHCYDYMPSLGLFEGSLSAKLGTYRNVAFVKEQTERLVDQLIAKSTKEKVWVE